MIWSELLSVQTTTEEWRHAYRKILLKNCCHECLKHNLHLLQQNSCLTEFLSKRRNKINVATKKRQTASFNSVKHSKESVTTTQTSASVHYLLLIIRLIEVYDPMHAHTTPIIMMIMQRMIWKERERSQIFSVQQFRGSNSVFVGVYVSGFLVGYLPQRYCTLLDGEIACTWEYQSL